MRDIKFRAYYLKPEKRALHHKAYAEWSTGWEGCSLGHVMANPNYAVVQYTGLLDKNDVEIYEGDILRWVHWEQEEVETPDVDEVVYLEVEARFALTTYRSGEVIEGGRRMDGMDEFEVIGNIYENPELLKAGGNE